MDLFASQPSPHALVGVPLAERIRPKSWIEFFGQHELTEPTGLLRQWVERQELSSLILWGPPGSGKTTLALMMAQLLNWQLIALSAVSSGVKELRQVIEEAEQLRKFSGKRTLLFIDEIHRFNKAQQDALLPYVERGSVVLIGATTENPSFEVNAALLSRMHVFILQPLSVEEIIQILKRALQEDHLLKTKTLSITDSQLRIIATHANSDARAALNILEYLQSSGRLDKSITNDQELMSAMSSAMLYHDKSGQAHYDTISALHKSMRNSDPDASLYWLARLLEAGDDPLYVARRLVRFASEDIGLADPQALTLAIAAKDTAHFVGMPECELALAQAVLYMALTAKNNSVYSSYTRVKQSLKAGEIYPVPYQLRNAVTKMDKSVGFGKGYQYAHHHDLGITNMSCLPEKLAKSATGKYYVAKKIGLEKDLVDGWQKRIARLKVDEGEGNEGNDE